MQILGLYYDRPFLRFALIDSRGKRVKIQSLKSWIPNSSEDVKQIYTAKRSDRIATAAPALVRRLDFKVSSVKHLDQIIPFQIESMTSIPIEDLAYTADFHLTKENQSVNVFFTAKKTLKQVLQECGSFSCVPDLVTSTGEALVKFSKFRCPDLLNALLIDLGSQEWTCVWIQNGRVQKLFAIDEGIECLLQALCEDRKKILSQKEIEGIAKQIDLLQLKTHLNPNLSDRLFRLRNKLTTVIFSFEEAGSSNAVFFTGRVNAFGHLREYLLEASECQLYEPPTPLSCGELECAIAIGSALERSMKKSKQLQFLKRDFTSEKSWISAGFWALFLLFFSLVFSAFLLTVGSSRFRQQKQEIVDSFKKLLEQMDKKLADDLFINGVDSGIELAMSSIQKNNKESPYLPQTPSVSEFLAWISSHPFLQTIQNSSDPIEINHIKYELVSFPQIGTLTTPYLGKVELEFQVKSSMNARKFHEALLEGDAMVDSTQEITWEALSDSYRTSFYLKNRIFHVR